MAYSEYERSEAASQTPAEAEQTVPDPKPTPDASLLEQVLRETLVAADSGEPLDPADTQTLVAVARRHRNSPLRLDPVAVDLVQSILQGRFRHLSGRPEFLATMSRQIAETLMDDPQTRQRLEAFWSRLSEAAK